MTLRRILFRIWLTLSLIWLAFWGNVVGLDPDALALLAQPRVYAQIIVPPLILGAACALLVLALEAVQRYLRARRDRAP
jgi:hypothetical protein